MASNVKNTGAAGELYIEANVIGIEPWNNRSLISYAFYLRERVSSPTTWSGGGISASTTTPSFGLWSGTFGFDWRPSGLQNTLIASGTYWQGHNAEGYGSTIVAGTIGATNTSGAGGPTSVDVFLDLGKFTVVPGQPTNFTVTYVSDTQAKLDWAQSSASNGQPTANRIESRVNGGDWTEVVTIAPTTSATVATAANRKTEYRIAAGNSAGWTGWTYSAASYTTPAAPTNGAAAKNASNDIIVTFTPNVAYAEHTHEVWHGVVAGGVTTWDATALTTLAAGVASYTHTAPNSAQVHVYRIRSKAGTLVSDWNVTNSVQLLAPPNKPTLPALAQFADKASALTISWQHNTVDTTPQKAYEFSYSTNGGTTWSTTGKVTSAVSSRTIAASTYAANTTLTMRVRTWGSATTGGSDGTGASDWSDIKAVTFKTIPVATITSPANGSTVNDATLRVTLGFSQAEAATFVKAQLELLQGATLLETKESTILVGITMSTPVQNGVSYTIRARVQDSNGLWSAWKSNTFNVTYLPPVPPVVAVTYLEAKGYGQIDITVPAPGAGQSAIATLTVTRTINGVTETLVQDYAAAPSLTFLDTIPTIHGTNTYTITAKSALGAQVVIVRDMVTTECRRAFLSKGAGFNNVVVFGGNLSVTDALGVASDTVQAAGRKKPIGLYGVETSMVLKVKSFIFSREGYSTIPELREFLLVPGRTCYRDSSGRRVFGAVAGQVAYKKTDRGDLSFTMTETS